MTDTDMDVFAAMKGGVIGTATDGSSWVGTKCWLVRDDAMGTPAPEAMDRVVAHDFTIPLERVRHGLIPVLARGYGEGELERGYERPDGITIWLNDAIVRYFESYFEGIDENDGGTIPADLVLRQAERRFGTVGVFQGDVLVAITMPVMHINEQLTDGKGGLIEDTAYGL